MARCARMRFPTPNGGAMESIAKSFIVRLAYATMKRFFLLSLLLLAALVPAQAEEPDDDYVHVYALIQEGDALGAQQQMQAATAKYLQARTELLKLRKNYPDWSIRVVAFRLSYLEERLAETNRPPPTAPARTAPAPPPSGAAPPPPALDPGLPLQLAGLREQLRQVQSDRLLLEAKLREALAVQPASADPRELLAARDRIQLLEKQTSLLNACLLQKPSAAPDSKPLEEARKDLSAAKRRLAEQSEQLAALESDRKKLQATIQARQQPRKENPAPESAQFKSIRKDLAESERKLAALTQAQTALLQDRDSLQVRLKSALHDAETAASLLAENKILKRRTGELQTSTRSENIQSTRLEKQLAEARSRITSLETERKTLQSSNVSLESKVKELSAAKTASPPGKSATEKESARVAEIRRERDSLRDQLLAAQKELSKRKTPYTTATLEELQDQLTLLRTRLAVLQAPAIPYTPEELALLQPPAAKPETADTLEDPSLRKLPAGSSAMVAEAQKFFARRQYDRAEQTYKQVLQLAPKSVNTLVNLGVIQMEQNHLEDADKSLQQAVAIAPNDAYSLSMLGQLKFQQGKYEEALNHLSRAAALAPKNAEIQNRLGIALSQKGLRDAAEKAFRKALQLDPNYGDAHNNLAVFYLTQNPPSTQLARWHYQRALALGFPHNPPLEKMLEQAATNVH